MTTEVRQPVIGDAFGQVLTRCWEAGVRTGVAFEVIERDDGYITVGDAARYFASPDDWSPVERWACEQTVGRVLDVGCGAGRHAVALAETGCAVLGVDPSPGAVAVARARGVQAVQGSVGDLPADYLLLSEPELAEVIDGSPWALHSIERDGARYALRLDLR
jgi:SAM-dependent methyltransferase